MTRVAGGEFTLARAIAPMSVDRFLAEYCAAREYLHIARRDSAFYDRHLSLAAFERLLAESMLKYPDVRLFRRGKRGSLQSLTAAGLIGGGLGVGDVNRLDRLRAAFAEGYTLAVAGESFQPVQELCRDIEGTFEHGVDPVLFLTPPSTQGLPLHRDPDDVLIFQLAGTKRWKLYRPDPAIDPEQLASTAPDLDVVLEAGDFLFLPQGYIHACVSGAEPSLHLTIGIKTHTWADLLIHAVTLARRQNEALSRPLPIGAIGLRSRHCAESGLSELLRQVAASTTLEQVMADFGRSFYTSRRPVARGNAFVMPPLDAVTLDAWLTRPASVPCCVTLSGDEAVMSYPGGHLTVPVAQAPALDQIARTRGCRVGDLLCESDATRIALARLLVQAGVVDIENRSDWIRDEDLTSAITRALEHAIGV